MDLLTALLFKRNEGKIIFTQTHFAPLMANERQNA
jgi:hypothetical protein